MHKEINNKVKMWLLITIPSIFVLLSIFFALTKTSILGLLFGGILFIYLTRKIKYKKEVSKKFMIGLGSIIGILGIIILYVKRNLFLHPEAILGRVENLITSINMFFYNPFGYGLGIAGPASQLGTSNNEALAESARKFLPENWYVQILLEQSIVGLALFISILVIIGTELWKIVKIKRDYLSIGIFVSYLSILFMGNFTHVFEESATSLTLFLIIGAYIALESREFRK